MATRHWMAVAAVAALGFSALVRGPLLGEAKMSGIVPDAPERPTTLDEFMITRMSGGFRAIFINALWLRAVVAERNYQYYELYTLYNRIRMLQPRYPQVWVQNGYNMGFQMTWDAETPRENWEWIEKAIAFGLDGMKYNPEDADIPEMLATVYDLKITQLITDPASGRPDRPIYRGYLWERMGQRYSREALRWLEVASEKENCSPNVLSSLWNWYTMYMYRAIGAGDREAADGWLARRGAVEEAARRKPEFGALYRSMRKINPSDFGMACAQVTRMGFDDLAAEETTDEGRWAWINGALARGNEFLERHEPGREELLYYARLRLRLGEIYMWIGTDRRLVPLFERDHPDQDRIALAGVNLSAARDAFKTAMGDLKGPMTASPGDLPAAGRSYREAAWGTLASLMDIWIMANGASNEKEMQRLNEDVDNLLSQVREVEEKAFYERFSRGVETMRKRAAEAARRLIEEGNGNRN